MHVDFVFAEMPVAEIPGIIAYRSAFDAAKRTNSHAPEAAEAQIERITESLEKELIPVLQVIDNGVGLGHSSNQRLAERRLNEQGWRRSQVGGVLRPWSLHCVSGLRPAICPVTVA